MIDAKEFTKAVVLELAGKLGVTIIYTPEEPPGPDDEVFDHSDIHVRSYAVVDSDLKLVVGYHGYYQNICGRLHTPAYLEHAKRVFKRFADGPYFDPYRIEPRWGEILGVLAEPKWDCPYYNQ
jgi:hypothetical protein